MGYLNYTIYTFMPSYYEETENLFWDNGYQYDAQLLFGGYELNATSTWSLAWIPSPVNAQQNTSWFVDMQAMTFMNANIFSPTQTSTASFMTGYNFIGLPSSIWTQVCNSLATYHSSQATILCN